MPKSTKEDKKGAIRKVTMDKYLMTQKWLVKLVPNLRVCDMNRIAYQQLLNDYEAAAYSGIGADKLRELSDREDCEFVLWNGTKRLIKRKKLDEFLERAYSI